MVAVLPTSGLAPAGAQTIVLTAIGAAALPPMTNDGTSLFGVDFAQIAVPGDAAIQVDLFASPTGLVAGLVGACDGATALVSATQALGLGTLIVSVVMTFASGARIRRDVALPVAPLPALPAQPADVLDVNGFPLTFAGFSIQVGAA